MIAWAFGVVWIGLALWWRRSTLWFCIAVVLANIWLAAACVIVFPS